MRIGSLCSGYGGLDMGVQAVLGGDTVWVSDIDKGANKILAHRYPNVPNLGDFTGIDWGGVEPVDVLTAGYPCQPFSHAGRRKGTTDARHIWPHVRTAIRVLRPRLTVLENVAGHRSLGFDRVLGDLAEDGMHVRWTSLRAADIGAPHGRERLFITVTQDPDESASGQRGVAAPGQAQGGRPWADVGGRGGAPSAEVREVRQHLDPVVGGGLTLLPTPAVNDMGEGKTVERWDEWTADMQAKHGNGNGHGKSLAIEAQRLLPTPKTKNNENRQSESFAHGEHGGNFHRLITGEAKWGDYAGAITRWEGIHGRPAPEPTQRSARGNPQLSPRFVEFMMGLPAGWVTDVPDITRNEALKALGNGVVPQQAAVALRTMLTWSEVAA